MEHGSKILTEALSSISRTNSIFLKMLPSEVWQSSILHLHPCLDCHQCQLANLRGCRHPNGPMPGDWTMRHPCLSCAIFHQNVRSKNENMIQTMTSLSWLEHLLLLVLHHRPLGQQHRCQRCRSLILGHTCQSHLVDGSSNFESSAFQV